MIDNRWLPDGIDPADLAKVVSQVLGQETLTVREWECQSLYEPRVDTTQGVYLMRGAALAAGGPTAWSVVLKVLAATPDGSFPVEAALYRSGLPASLEHGLIAPRCFGVVNLPAGGAGLWLEYLHDLEASWTQRRFGLTASHLGRFNAEQTLHDTAPNWSWLRRINWRALIEGCEENITKLRGLQEHPVVRRAYPDHVAKDFLHLWEMRQPLLHTLEHAPHVVSHGDAQRRNLFAGQDANGAPCTVAIDWANMSLRPVGADIVTLIHQALMYFDADVHTVVDLDRDVFSGYLSGLVAAGWAGDVQQVRFAYTTQLALGLGLLELGWVLRLALDENRQRRAEALFGRPLVEILDRRAAIGRWLISLAHEAYAFAHPSS